MKSLARGFMKFIILYVAVLFILMILPVFLITDNVAILNQGVDYLFSTKK